ncbi:MAG: hypothetical protein WCG84_03605 [Candidatus Moraniibacteriota bacterium]
MDKQTFLRSVREAGEEQIATESEVVTAYREGSQSSGDSVVVGKIHLDVSQILSYLGGGIVAIGIGIFVEQNWDMLNISTRIFVTLGIGVIAFWLGNILIQKKHTQLGLAAHLIAGITLTIGLFVTLDAFGYDTSQFNIQTLIFTLLFAVYVAAYSFLRSLLFVSGGVIFGSALFVVLTSWLGQNSLIQDFETYQMLMIGSIWVLLGTAWIDRKEAPFTSWLFFFGLPLFFIAALTLGGNPSMENWFWMIVFPALALGSMMLSLPLKSRIFLGWGAFFLVIDIFKITADYFSQGFGWPLALVIAGLALMAVGTLVVRVNKQHTIQKEQINFKMNEDEKHIDETQN